MGPPWQKPVDSPNCSKGESAVSRVRIPSQSETASATVLCKVKDLQNITETYQITLQGLSESGESMCVTLSNSTPGAALPQP